MSVTPPEPQQPAPPPAPSPYVAPPAPSPYPGAVPPKRTLGILALVFGLVGAVLALLALIPIVGVIPLAASIAAIVLGFLALRREAASRGMSIAGVILGFVGLLFSLLFIVIGLLLIAGPIFLGQQDAAHDSGTESDLANAKIAVVAFYTSNPGTTTAPPLSQLGQYGFSQSSSTASIDYGVTPQGIGEPFCIEAVSVTGTQFHTTDSQGVERGGC